MDIFDTACEECGRVFRSPQALGSHRRVHARRIVADDSSIQDVNGEDGIHFDGGDAGAIDEVLGSESGESKGDSDGGEVGWLTSSDEEDEIIEGGVVVEDVADPQLFQPQLNMEAEDTNHYRPQPARM